VRGRLPITAATRGVRRAARSALKARSAFALKARSAFALKARSAFGRGPARAARAASHAPVPSPAELAAERDRRDFESMRRLLAFVLEPDSCCIDVGAHRGAVLAEMLRCAPAGRHIAFEPIPALAAHLRRAFPGVEVREAALSDHAGEARFAHVRGEAEGWSGLRFRPLPTGEEAEVEEITVTLEVLDELLDPHWRPAVIKVDVEGAEEQVLRGALGTLRRHHPLLIFEHGTGSAEVFDTAPGDIHRLLTADAGMRIFDLDGNGPYGLREFERTFHAAERVNFVAHR
jgi:FkbM family methyltransferase